MNKKNYKYEHIFFLCYINGESKTYTYDAQGNRTRKVVEKNNVREERYYINGYEVFRKYVSDSLDFERKSLSVYSIKVSQEENEEQETITKYETDTYNKFLLLETKTIENGQAITTPVTVIRYQYSNHLGSACLELDNTGQIISYEEYHPFGTTSYRSGGTEIEVSLKRYKYNCKERDEETGLYAYGMRYYAAWLCRFVSVDPLQFEYPELTPFQYASNRPITCIDLDGCEAAVRPSPTIRSSPNTRRSPNNNFRGVNPYGLFPGGVMPASTKQTKTFQRRASMTPISTDNLPSYTQTIRTAGENDVQISSNNTRGMLYIAIGELADNFVLNFEFVKMAFYKPDGRVENKTEIRLLDFKDQMRQTQWEMDYQKLTNEIGQMPLLNPFNEESVKKYNEYQQTVRDKIGTSPKQEIMIEYMLHPERFKQIDSKKEVIPEFRQGE